jgi:hypothetical protein
MISRSRKYEEFFHRYIVYITAYYYSMLLIAQYYYLQFGRSCGRAEINLKISDSKKNEKND